MLPYRYALALQYRGLAAGAAPDLVPVYDGLSSELSAAVTDKAARTRASRHADVGKAPRVSALERYEASTNVAERERYALAIFADRLREGEFGRAREFAAKMDDIDARAQAAQLADFSKSSIE